MIITKRKKSFVTGCMSTIRNNAHDVINRDRRGLGGGIGRGEVRRWVGGGGAVDQDIVTQAVDHHRSHDSRGADLLPH